MNFVLRTLTSYFVYAKIFFKLCPRYPLLYRTLKSNLNIISYVLNNNSYTQLSFAFLVQKDFDDDDTDVFFLLLLQKHFDICLMLFFAILLFLLQKDFDRFHVLLLLPFIYIYIYTKKIISLFLLVFFKFSSWKFSLLEFYLSDFYLSESEEISISSVIYVIYLHSFKCSWG